VSKPYSKPATAAEQWHRGSLYGKAVVVEYRGAWWEALGINSTKSAPGDWFAFVAHHTWLDETGPAKTSRVLLVLAASQFAVVASQLVLTGYSLQWTPFAGLGVGSLGGMLLILSSCESSCPEERESKAAASAFKPPPRKPTLWALLSALRASAR